MSTDQDWTDEDYAALRAELGIAEEEPETIDITPEEWAMIEQVQKRVHARLGISG